jgi:glycosyltransferase involved in cell wall biosynthesis
MRIGFEAKRATHNLRGLGNYSRGLIDGLVKYHPECELYLYTPPITKPQGLAWTQELPTATHLRSPESAILKMVPALWRSFLMAGDIEKDKLDIFHGLSHEIPFRLDSLPIKKVVTMHDLIFMRYPEFFPMIDRLVYAQKFRYACKHSDLVIAICEQTKTDLIHLLGVPEKKIVVHYQSCSPQFYGSLTTENLQNIREKYDLRNNFILNVGAFEPRKNQLNLLEAFASIAQKVEVDLILVGQGSPYKEQVAKRIQELNLINRVKILSDVPHADLPGLYQLATVFCFPSLFEGFGIPIIEALFSQAPVVTSLGSCFPESAGPGSEYIDPLSRSSIASGLLKVLQSEEQRKQMIQTGLEYVSRFHLKNSTDQLVQLYTQLMAN